MRWSRMLVCALVVTSAGCVPPSSPPTARSVSMGGFHSCALMSDGTVRCWGQNDRGQVGNGSVGPFSVPTPAQVAGLSGVVDVAGGYLFSCAATSIGEAWCWGADDSGQLGDGVTGIPLDNGNPLPVVGPTGVTAVAAGLSHACAVAAGGAVWCWGADDRGQLGDGTVAAPASRPSPQLVPGVSGAIDIAAGANFTCALLSAGGVACWGDDTGGTLGDGVASAPPQRATATAVVGLSDATAISAGADFICALRSTGAVVCWGWDFYGQLGDGTSNASPTASPSTVVGLPASSAVGVGAYQACAVSVGGTVSCWGLDSSGQVGDGTVGPTINPAPATVVGLVDASGVDGGDNHTCAVRSNGRVACWGSDNAGALGDGTPGAPSANPSPVAVLGI